MPRLSRLAATAVRRPLLAGASLLACAAAQAWGDEGHEVVALVARGQLTPGAAAAVDRFLAQDHGALKMRDGGLTSDSFARQATWADYYRDGQRTTGATPERIHSYDWHFVDIELHGPNLDAACFGFPRPAPGTRASDGPDPACVVDKIEQFAAELGAPGVADEEKLLALKFLMHFVGDLHQPLHAADNDDRGGNDERARVNGETGALHHHWDQTFVALVGSDGRTAVTDPAQVAAALRRPTPVEATQWLGRPQPRAWAWESYDLARRYAYALPAPTVASGSRTATVELGTTYVNSATTVVADQLLKGGYRLAAMLNAALDPPPAPAR